MKNSKSLVAGALVFSGLATLAGSGWVYATTTLVTTMEGLTTCLTTNNSVCTLGENIAVDGIINILQDTKVSLDLNGYKLYENENQSLTITNHGDLTILDSGTTTGSCDAEIRIMDNGQLEISNGTFNDVVTANSDNHIGNTSIKISGGIFNNSVSARDNGSLLNISGGKFNYVNFDGTTANISDGTFNGYVSIESGTVTISKGTFNDAVSLGYTNDKKVSATISDGTFFGSVRSRSGSSMIINSGTFNGDVSSHGDDEINGGDFKGTLFVGDPGSSLVINGGTFDDVNAIVYEEGSSLKITDGKFTKGFAIGLENVSITGGTFYNGTESEGWMALILDHPDTQKYSITGGTFLNTAEDDGTLMAIKTVTRPTLASIQSLFAGGTVLNGTVIDLDESEDSPYYWSYIKKQKTNADEADIMVPDTGVITKSSDELKAISGIVVGVMVLFMTSGSIVFKSRKELFKKRVNFNKK